MKVRRYALSLMMLVVVTILSACGGGGGSSTSQVDTHPVVNEETLDPVEGIISYKSVTGKGYAHVCPGTDTPGKPRNFLIKVNGFSPNRVDQGPVAGELTKTCDALSVGRNYHVIDMRYYNGGDYIQRNAGVVQALINLVINKYQISDNDHLAVVGYSMGGLVSRYALLSMQSAGELGPVDLFVTVDSPHYGAYVPLGAQYLAWKFSAKGGADSLAMLNSNAATQMLRYHYTQGTSSQTWTDEFQELYITELQGMLGGFPSAPGLRTVAVSSGRSDGVLSEPVAGQLYYSGKQTKVGTQTVKFSHKISGIDCTIGLNITLDTAIDILVRARSLPLSGTALAEVAATDTVLYAQGYNLDTSSGVKSLKTYISGKVTTSGAGCFLISQSTIDSNVSSQVDSQIANLPNNTQLKSTLDTFKGKVFSTYADGVTSEGVPGGLASDLDTLRQNMVDNSFNPVSGTTVSMVKKNVFIPVGSALGIKDLNPVLPATLQVSDLEAMSPFDKIYIEGNTSLDHLSTTTGWYTKEVVSLFNQ